LGVYIDSDLGAASHVRIPCRAVNSPHCDSFVIYVATTPQLVWYSVSDALAILHWLRLPERVIFKLALMAYRVLNGLASL